jgi:signal peptidase II
MKPVPASRYVAFFLIAACALGWDLFTKTWAFSTLGFPHHESDPLAWLWGENVFKLMTSFNHGALWGMGQGYSWLFASMSIIAAGAIFYWLFRGAAQSRWLTVALALIMAGTLGNLYDRLGLHDLRNLEGQVEHAVRDFLYIEVINWPIFNFADSYLVTGAIMLLIHSFQMEDENAGPGGSTRAEPVLTQAAAPAIQAQATAPAKPPVAMRSLAVAGWSRPGRPTSARVLHSLPVDGSRLGLYAMLPGRAMISLGTLRG